MTELFNAIYESYDNDLITESQKDEMISIYMESFIDPIKNFVAKVKEIKKEKPREYDGPEEVKKFVDKHYDDIIKASEIIEKEPEKLRRNEVTYLITMITSTILSIAVTALLPGFEIAGLVLFMIGDFVAPTVITIINYVRQSHDIKVADDLNKISSALKKLNSKKLDKDTQNKISDLITAISDAETEISKRMKVTNESVNELKLSIYEKCAYGEITESERDILLEMTDEKLIKSTWKRSRDLAKITDLNKLEETLIKHANKSRLSNNQCKIWSETYSDKSEDNIFKKLKSLDLGYCYSDAGGNYVVYSNKTKKFYFFDHELDGEENLKNTWSVERIRKHLDDFEYKINRRYISIGIPSISFILFYINNSK